jgi:hypothetical protein
MAKKEAKEQVQAAALGDTALEGDRRIVVVDEDMEHDGALYKAGNHDLPMGLAADLVDAEKAHVVYGKGKGR